MSAEEPTKIGTVVTLSGGSIAVSARITARRLNWAMLDRDGGWLGWAKWDHLDNPVVVHEGYTPPTPEPTGHGARVIDADGWRCTRAWDEDGCVRGRAWASPKGGLWAWSDLTQPVTVISDGNDW